MLSLARSEPQQMRDRHSWQMEPLFSSLLWAPRLSSLPLGSMWDAGMWNPADLVSSTLCLMASWEDWGILWDSRHPLLASYGHCLPGSLSSQWRELPHKPIRLLFPACTSVGSARPLLCSWSAPGCPSGDPGRAVVSFLFPVPNPPVATAVSACGTWKVLGRVEMVLFFLKFSFKLFLTLKKSGMFKWNTLTESEQH